MYWRQTTFLNLQSLPPYAKLWGKSSWMEWDSLRYRWKSPAPFKISPRYEAVRVGSLMCPTHLCTYYQELPKLQKLNVLEFNICEADPRTYAVYSWVLTQISSNCRINNAVCFMFQCDFDKRHDMLTWKQSQGEKGNEMKIPLLFRHYDAMHSINLHLGLCVWDV